MIVRIFGTLRQAIGSGTLTAPDDLKSVAALEDWIVETYPSLAGHRASWRVAVDQEYVRGECPLSTDSEIAVIPPVSGGSAVQVELVDQPIDPEAWRITTLPADCGASAEFLGVVRGQEKGDTISALHYEIYPGMTEKELRNVAEETLEAHPIREIRVVHRHGRIAVGEGALWVQVISGHRAEAFAAVEHCIRRIKEVVPIWKVDSNDS